MENWIHQWMPLELKNGLLLVLSLLPVTFLGRVLWHRQMVMTGRRDRFWSKDLLWEVPTALLCAVLAGGAASWLNADPSLTHAIAGVVGWLGPRGLEYYLARLAAKYTTGKSKKENC